MICTCAAQAQPVRINSFETLGAIHIDDPADDPAAQRGQPASATLSFDAFGRRFNLSLQRNNRLTQNLSPSARRQVADVVLYAGSVVGLPGSWARLARSGASVSGVVWDGADLYALEPLERVASVLSLPKGATPGSTVIYRWRDTLGRAGDAVADPLSLATSGMKQIAAAVQSLAAPLSPGKQVSIGLVADAELVKIYGGGTAINQIMLNTVNIVDAIFGEQLGVHLSVEEIIDGPQPDPFTSSDPVALKTALGNYKNSTPALHDLGLVHLFTGRQLSQTPGEQLNIIGIANLGTLCNSGLAVSLHEATAQAVFPDLVVAHEMGHVFGAPHDGEAGSACAATPQTFLMAPVYNGSKQFSDCSIQQMLAKVASAVCVVGVPPNDVSVQPQFGDTVTLTGKPFSGGVYVGNTGPSTAFGVQVTFTPTNLELTQVFGLGGCTKSGAAFICNAYELGTGSPQSVGFTGVSKQPGHGTIDVAVTSWNDPNPANNSYRFDIDFTPTVDFDTVALTASPDAVHPGETSTIEWDFVNPGPATATNVALVIWSLYFDPLQFTPPGGGTCTPDPTTVRQWKCPIGTVPPNQPLHMSMRVRAPSTSLPPGTVQSDLVLSATATEPQLNNNHVSPPVVIATSIDDLISQMTAPTSVAEGDNVDITMVVRNDGPDTAHNVAFFLRADGITLQVTDFKSESATCGPGVADPLECKVNTLASGASVSATVHGQVRIGSASAYMFATVARSDDFDRLQTNNAARTTLTITSTTPPPTTPPPVTPPTSPPVSGETSGGGAADMFSLFGLLVIFVLRRTVARHAGRQPT